MPKRDNLRKHKAAELLALVQRGPSFSYDTFGMPKDQSKIETDVKLWLSSWVEPLILQLVPELKKPKKI